MLDALSEFPFLVANLRTSKCPIGELRLLVKLPIVAQEAECEVHLLRFQTTRIWQIDLCKQCTSGKGKLQFQDDGTVLVSGIIDASLTFGGELVVGEALGAFDMLLFEFVLRRSESVNRKWKLKGTIQPIDSDPSGRPDSDLRVHSPQGVREFHARANAARVVGNARLFRSNLTGFDSEKRVQAELFLPLVPIVIDSASSSSKNAALESFENLREAADGLWAAKGNTVPVSLVSGTPGFLQASDKIVREAYSGSIGALNIELVSQFAGKLDGVPVVLLEKFGVGKTVTETPMRCSVFIKADHLANPMALAHEVGHVLGGEHDDDTTVSAGRWMEVKSAPTVMRPADVNVAVLGPEAMANAPRWALFREK